MAGGSVRLGDRGGWVGRSNVGPDASCPEENTDYLLFSAVSSDSATEVAACLDRRLHLIEGIEGRGTAPAVKESVVRKHCTVARADAAVHFRSQPDRGPYQNDGSSSSV